MRRIVWLVICGIAWLAGFGQLSFGQNPELVLGTGHTRDILSIAFSSDGRILASGSEDKTIKLWDVVTGQEIKSLNSEANSLEDFDDFFRSIAFSPDGKVLASASFNGIIIFWDFITGQQINVIKSQIEGNNLIIFSPDGKTLALFSRDSGMVKLWETETGTQIKSLEVDNSSVESIAFSPDGKILASGSKDNIIKLWDLATGQPVKTLEGHKDEISSLAFSPDGKILASGSEDNTIKLWDPKTGIQIKTFEVIGPSYISFSPDGKTLASGNRAGYTHVQLKLWDIATGQIIKIFEDPKHSITSPVFSPDGAMVAVGIDNTVKLWNFKEEQPIRTLENRASRFYSVVFSPDGKYFAAGSDDKTVKLWSLKTGTQIKIFTDHKSVVKSVVFSPDGKTLASSGDEEIIRLWNVETGQLIKTFKANFFGRASTFVTSTAFSQDGKLFASGSTDGAIRIWSIASGELIGTARASSFSVDSVIFSLDGKYIVSCSTSEGVIKMRSLETGQLTRTFNASVQQVLSISLSPDGKTLASASNDEKIRLWNVETGQLINTFQDSLAADFSLDFSPDGKLLASGNFDRTVKLWDVETGQKIRTFKDHTDTVSSVAFSRDGKMLASGGADATVKLWGLKDEKPLATLVPLDENNWLTTTPDGLFDGTPAAWKQLIWRFSNNIYDYTSVETYFNDFFYPNLLQDILNGKSPKPKAGQELEKIDRRQPKVEIASTKVKDDQRTVKITLQVSDNISDRKQPSHQRTSGARDVRLFRNGSLVKIWHGDVLQGKSSVTLAAEVPIVAGENNLTAYAFNSQNVKSNDDRVSVKGSDTLKREGTLYVLAVGVNKYADSKYNLNFAVTDVEKITETIKSEQIKLAQYSKTEIITLTDSDATRDNILLALRRFSEGNQASIPANASDKLKTELSKIKMTQPEDALIIHFSGHGTSREQRFYLLPHNFTDSKQVESQAVSDLELNQSLEKVDAGRLLMIIDACQSGQALGEQSEGRAPMNSKGLAQLAYDKGMLILTAAQSYQAALEAVRLGEKKIEHGLLTYSLLQAFLNQEADKDQNRQLWEREWFDYAVEQVPLLQVEAMKQRNAEIKQTGRGSDIVYLNGDDPKQDPEKRRVQTPRVFYRREAETNPLIIAKP